MLLRERIILCLGAALILALLTGCASPGPHPATTEADKLQRRTVTSWAITPGDKAHRLDIYVDNERTPAASFFLVP